MANNPTPRLVILESPYAGHGETEHEVRARVHYNVEYARRCLRDSLLRGEAPIASHLLYTQPGVLDDYNPDERAMGIAAGLAWLPKASYSVFYTDRGWSPGMLSALHDHNLRRCYPFNLRSLKGKASIQIPTTLDKDLERLLYLHMED